MGACAPSWFDLPKTPYLNKKILETKMLDIEQNKMVVDQLVEKLDSLLQKKEGFTINIANTGASLKKVLDEIENLENILSDFTSECEDE